MKRGLFPPELTLGAAELKPRQTRELGDFLVELCRSRDFPLHVANLWNALYFGYDLQSGGYIGEGLELERIPARWMNTRDEALPVGGFVRVQTETSCGELWAEVIYKEGRFEGINAEWLLPALSGAPAAAGEDGIAVVREALVLDYDAFGSEWNEVKPTQYRRILRNGHWLDPYGHLILDAVYRDGEEDLDDLTFYARYLFREHRAGLLAHALTDEAADDQVWQALLESLEAVRELAEARNELDSWRGYFFTRESYRARCADDGADSVLGAGDLQSIYASLRHPSAHENVSYLALGPLILDYLESSDGLSEEELAAVVGTRYVTAVCYASDYVRDQLDTDACEGLLPNSLHLRLDDDWQAGGIWRLERVNGNASLQHVPPLIPLGLGYAESRSDIESVAPEKRDDLESIIVTSSQTNWNIALAPIDLNSGELRLSPAAADALAPGAQNVLLNIAVCGQPLALKMLPYDAERCVVSGIIWPLAAFPGLIVHCSVDHGTIGVRMKTERLVPPRVIEGVTLEWEFDERLYRRAVGADALSNSEKRKATTLRDLVQRAFRNRGRDAGDGGKELTLPEVVAAILGAEYRPDESIPIVIALQELKLDFDNGHYTWRPRLTRRARAVDRSLLVAYGETNEKQALRRVVRAHWVAMHIRRYRVRQPSAEKIASYEQARAEARMYHQLPEALQENCTWVRAYRVGSEDEVALDEIDEEEPVELTGVGGDGVAS